MTTARGPRGPYQNGLRRREQVLDTAVMVFGQHGYHAGSLRLIAKAVGVTPAAIIRLFGSKEALLTAVLDRSDGENNVERTTGSTGLQFLRDFAAILARQVHRKGMIELLLTMAAEASDEDHPARPYMVGRYEAVVQAVAEALHQAVRDGDVLPMSSEDVLVEARGFIALMDGLELQWLLNPSMDLVATHAALFDATVSRWQGGASGRVARSPRGEAALAGPSQTRGGPDELT